MTRIFDLLNVNSLLFCFRLTSDTLSPESNTHLTGTGLGLWGSTILNELVTYKSGERQSQGNSYYAVKRMIDRVSQQHYISL